MTSTLANRLKLAREQALRGRFKSATAAARYFGWNENTYRSTENGTRPPGRGAAVEYARAFGVSVDWLLTGRGAIKGERQYRHVPLFLLTDITARTKIQLRRFIVSAEPRGFVLVPDDGRLSTNNTLAVVVEDESMVDPHGGPQSLYPGDKAIFAVDKSAPPGSIILVNDGNANVIRKLRVVRGSGDAQVIALVPLNPDYPATETTARHIIGVLVGQYRDR